MNHRTIFRLKVYQSNQSCRFEWSWGQGAQSNAILDYPETLTKSYQVWQQAYLRFYRTAVRGKVVNSGSLSPDLHRQLRDKETQFLSEFRQWLDSAILSQLKRDIVKAANRLTGASSNKSNIDEYSLDIFLTCDPIALERFPWEAWDIKEQIHTSIKIRLLRTPTHIRSEPISKVRSKYRQGGARILGIFGDNTGLNLEDDLKSLHSLSSLAEIKIVAWQPGKDIEQLKGEIAQAIIDEEGWDILFFAGHSTDIQSGELLIAPNTAILVSEIKSPLKKALSRGLQFALFNSCSGLSIANTLIDLGLSQVAIMREPIHNKVAQVFLKKFLEVLAEYKDVQEALTEACQFLKDDEKTLKQRFPSAYLIPSLFCYPETELFRIKPFGIKEKLKQWVPNRKQVIALGAITFLSILPPVQDFLLERRILIQAIYRDLTTQVPSDKPHILLVEIDDDSIQKAGIDKPKPMNRRYLAKLIDKLSGAKAKIIGLDYLVDKPQGNNDRILSQSIQNAVKQQEVQFVFAALEDEDPPVGVLPTIASLNWSLQGSINFDPNIDPNIDPKFVELPLNCHEICPFSYLLALVTQSNIPKPKLRNSQDERTEILDFLEQNSSNNHSLAFFQQTRLHPLTIFSAYFRQRWLHPINDFSLPINSIYQSIPAWQLLQETPQDLAEIIKESSVIFIASGGYQEAGINELEKDYFPIPLAVSFWQNRLDIKPYPTGMTKGEAQAYMIYHWLTQRFVIPIPDLWMILLATLLAKAVSVKLAQDWASTKMWLVVFCSAIVGLYLISLQLYITVGLLLPLVFPSLTFLSIHYLRSNDI